MISIKSLHLFLSLLLVGTTCRKRSKRVGAYLKNQARFNVNKQNKHNNIEDDNNSSAYLLFLKETDFSSL